MQAQIMTLDEIRPFIRFAEYTAGARTPRFVQAVDHRLFYVESGSGDVWVDGNVHGVAPGTLMYWMSGSPYTFLPKAGTELRLLSINFDFTWKHAGLTLPFPPSSDYQEEKRLENIRFSDYELLNAPIVLHDMAFLLPDLHRITEESQTGTLDALRLSGMLVSILAAVLQQADRAARPHARVCAAILDYIGAHYAEELDNAALGKIFGYHPGYVSQLICEQTGRPLHQHLLQMRIRQAIVLLQSTDLPVSDISARVGFQNVSYFSQYFKKQTGCSPSAFRQGLNPQRA